MRTQLPEDMEAADIKWCWSGFRVHLPNSAPRKRHKTNPLAALDALGLRKTRTLAWT